MSAPTIEEQIAAVARARDALDGLVAAGLSSIEFDAEVFETEDPPRTSRTVEIEDFDFLTALRAAEETLRQAQNPKRVVMHIEHVGDAPTIYSDDGVDVYSVFEPTPEDLIYRFPHRPIPDELLDGDVGFSGDGSAAEARLHRAVYHMTGEPHLRAVPAQDAETQENPDA